MYKSTNEPIVSRRRLFSQSGYLIASFIVLKASGQSELADVHESFSNSLQVKLVKEFKNAYLLDVSPDGRSICLYFTKHPQESFAWNGRWKEDNLSAQKGDEGLKVIETDSWNVAYSVKLKQKAFYASYFKDSRGLYVETLGFPTDQRLVSQQLLVDLRTKKQEERVRVEDPNGPHVSYRAIDDRMLLGAEFDGKTRTSVALIRAALPSYDELQRIPFSAIQPAPIDSIEADVVVSANRETFVYGVGHSLVYRRAEDLGAIWIREIEPDLSLWRVAVSAGGSRVAAAICEAKLADSMRRYYIGVYDGKNGNVLARLPINGIQGVAISPDLKLLAVGQRIELDPKTRETQPTIHIYDIASGGLVATLIHDRLRIQRGEYSYGSFGVHGIQFTYDGKYLISSSRNTKVWEIPSS